MGYETKEPVALCDGCGTPLYDGNEFWSLDQSPHSVGKVFTVITPPPHLVRMFETHYCRITPCLERAVVNELRKINGVYNDEPKTPEDSSEPIETVYGETLGCGDAQDASGVGRE